MILDIPGYTPFVGVALFNSDPIRMPYLDPIRMPYLKY